MTLHIDVAGFLRALARHPRAEPAIEQPVDDYDRGQSQGSPFERFFPFGGVFIDVGIHGVLLWLVWLFVYCWHLAFIINA